MTQPLVLASAESNLAASFIERPPIQTKKIRHRETRGCHDVEADVTRTCLDHLDSNTQCLEVVVALAHVNHSTHGLEHRRTHKQRDVLVHNAHPKKYIRVRLAHIDRTDQSCKRFHPRIGPKTKMLSIRHQQVGDPLLCQQLHVLLRPRPARYCASTACVGESHGLFRRSPFHIRGQHHSVYLMSFSIKGASMHHKGII